MGLHLFEKELLVITFAEFLNARRPSSYPAHSTEANVVSSSLDPPTNFWKKGALHTLHTGCLTSGAATEYSNTK